MPQLRHSATLRDVAREAGVSTVAVSSVLNGSRSNTRVSTGTRQRILEAADTLGYRPNAVARSLRRRSTDIIGFYSGYGYVNARDLFTSEIIGGIQEGCDAHHKDLLVHGTFHAHTVEDVYAEMVNGTLDGLVMLTCPGDPLVERLAASGMPAVVVTDPVPALPSVSVDDADGSRQIARLLAAQGHRHILYRASPEARVSAQRRLSAFCIAAEEHGMNVSVTYPPFPNTRNPARTSGQLTDEEETLLTRPARSRPTAAIGWSDTLAYPLLAECARLGLRIPEDLAVVGFDGIPPPIPPARWLTTVSAPWSTVARMAVGLLVRRISGEEVPAETVLPVELVHGDTA